MHELWGHTRTGCPPQAELRAHLHDALTADHDKDFRVLACLPLQVLADKVFVVLRLDYAGSLITETAVGEQAGPDAQHCWALISRDT